MKKKAGRLLTLLIFLGLALGVIVGAAYHHDLSNAFWLYKPIEWIQTIFGIEPYETYMGTEEAFHGAWMKTWGDLVLIRPLMLMIIPMVFVSVVVGVTSIGDPSRLGVLGGSALVYYLTTMLLAVTLGAILVSVLRPGDIAPADQAALTGAASTEFAANSSIVENIESAEARGQDRLGGAWMNILRQIIPNNVVREMSEGKTLGVIVFALLLGLGIAASRDKGRPAAELFESLFHVIMKLVGWIIWLTPIGVYFLVAWTVGRIGLDVIAGPLGKYIVFTIMGLFIHGVIVLPLILWLIGRHNPYRFMWQMRRALMTAFGTDSSSATLPVTMECAENEGGCSKRASNFVLPLGSTINMDGTALYEAVAVVFLFQLWGVDLSFGNLVVVVITATLAAIGAAGIPSAGLVTMVIVISAVNTSLSSTGKELPIAAIGVIIGVDRIIDMCRTMVNVWGDAVGAKLLTRLAPEDEGGEDAAPRAAA